MSRFWMRLDVPYIFERAYSIAPNRRTAWWRSTDSQTNGRRFEMSLIIFLVVGLIAGVLASYLMGRKNDLLTNLLIGVVGAVVGGLLGGVVGITASNLLGQVIIATAGAVLCIWLWQRMR